ncbi:unnamed protein product [Scytosiphon promiscuus]
MQAPPPQYYAGSGGAPAPSHDQAYRIYWGAMFGTVLTWVFSVTAASHSSGVSTVYACGSSSFFDNEDLDTICNLSKAWKAFQYMATILLSFTLVLVIFTAFAPAPKTGKLGLGVSSMLAVFAVLQLIAFAVMAAYSSKMNDLTSGLYNYVATRTLAVSMIACLLGLFGAAVTLYLRRRATTDQDGPLRAYTSAGGANGAPPPAGAPRATGTV